MKFELFFLEMLTQLISPFSVAPGSSEKLTQASLELFSVFLKYYTVLKPCRKFIRNLTEHTNVSSSDSKAYALASLSHKPKLEFWIDVILIR